MFNDIYASDRQIHKASGEFLEVVIQRADTERDAWGRQVIPKENIGVLGYLAAATKSRIKKRCSVC